MSLLHEDTGVEALSALSRFRDRFYDCCDARADALFELADAAICVEGPVTSLVELSLAPVFRRGHGALYDALAEGAVDEERMRDLLAAQVAPDAPLIFGVDATTFPRPNAECSPDRGLHYAPCRCDGKRKVVPGWEFQWVTGLEWGRSSWTLPVDARRIAEGACPVTLTADQIRDLAGRLGRQSTAGRPAPLFVLDQGYAAAALTHALDGLEVQMLVRIAGDRVFYDGRPGPRKPGPGRNGVHGRRFELDAKVNLRRPDQMLIVPDTANYGRAEVRAWHRMHQRCSAVATSPASAPRCSPGCIIEGTIIEVRVERLPDGRSPHRTMWLWHSGPYEPDLDVCWRAYLRRFDNGTHLQNAEVPARMDRRPAATPRAGGSLDMAIDRRLRPTPARPRPGRRSAPPVGATPSPGQTPHALPGPPRISTRT